MKTKVKGIFLTAMMSSVIASCTNDNFINSSALEDSAKESYEINFQKKYPNVDLNQSWDFSKKSTAYSLGNIATPSTRTRAVEGTWSKEDWYYVDNNTLDWMHEQLKEGENHTKLGNPFYMTIPNNEFYIVPVYQGAASAVWNLHVVIGDTDYLIWGKSEDIEIKDKTNQNWHKVWEVKTYEWGGDGVNWESLFNTDGTDRWTGIPGQGGERNKVTDVRAKPRKFSGYPVGAEMYFYLEIRTGDAGRCEPGTQQSSLNGMMLALQDVPRPEGIPADYETMIIGCEDANLSLSDWDMNDVVFLVYGKEVPKPIKIEEGTPICESKTVRYMIEDLGATDDFDFNDIVVDVTEYTEKTPIYTNGALTSWEYGKPYQKANIRHLGGTLPFILTIGNTEYSAGGKDSFGDSPNTEFDVTGWTGLTGNHNISVKVKQNTNDGVYYNVKFPKAGEVPMIIGVDPTQSWMTERQSVPESWFYTSED